MKVNTTNLAGAIANLQSRVTPMQSKDALHQQDVENVVAVLVNADNALANILTTADPGPRADLDFSGLDNAIAALKQNGKISQNDANAIARLITINIPQL